MKLCVNGAWEEQPEGLTLAAYLQAKGLEPRTVVAEHNGQIPDRAAWGTLALADGDVLEIIRFMGGG